MLEYCTTVCFRTRYYFLHTWYVSTQFLRALNDGNLMTKS
jgi:hypothetical protein